MRAFSVFNAGLILKLQTDTECQPGTESIRFHNAIFLHSSGQTLLCRHKPNGLTGFICEKIRSKDMTKTPMLLFVSDGSGGTGRDKETWRGFTEKFAENVDNEQIVELDCGHYVHDFEYDTSLCRFGL